MVALKVTGVPGVQLTGTSHGASSSVCGGDRWYVLCVTACLQLGCVCSPSGSVAAQEPPGAPSTCAHAAPGIGTRRRTHSRGCGTRRGAEDSRRCWALVGWAEQSGPGLLARLSEQQQPLVRRGARQAHILASRAAAGRREAPSAAFGRARCPVSEPARRRRAASPTCLRDGGPRGAPLWRPATAVTPASKETGCSRRPRCAGGGAQRGRSGQSVVPPLAQGGPLGAGAGKGHGHR